MSEQSETEDSGENLERASDRRPSRRRLILGTAAAALAALVALSALSGGDVIDLPAWANIRGVDVPLIGDTDAIDCRLEQVAGTTMVEIRIVDGDESTYDRYIHVWNNGNLVPDDGINRVDSATIISTSTEGADEQFYSISIEPVREGRVFCESVVLDR